MKLLQKSVKFLEKECESLSAKMSEIPKRGEGTFQRENTTGGSQALSAERPNVLLENRESHHVIPTE